jgi:N-acetylglucosaminyl-diphospho-decaprenol L-rhamnosyltransferase
MHVAVLIVSFRNPDDVVRCLEALAPSRHTDFEVVICENGGPDAYESLVRRIPESLTAGQRVKAVLAPSNLGYAGGVNTCLRESPGADAWWVLNPDTAPEPATMANLVARLASGSCDAVGCTIHFPDGMIESRGGRWYGWLGRAEALSYGERLGASDPPEAGQAPSYFSGASLLIGRRFLEAAGPMREDYFLYCEEIEWCLRAAQRGMRLGFEPKAKVLHYQGTTTGSVSDIRLRPRMPVYLDERNKMLVTRDCFPRRLPVAAAFAFAVLFARYIRRGAWRQFVYAFQGWFDGLRNRRGKPAWIPL